VFKLMPVSGECSATQWLYAGLRSRRGQVFFCSLAGYAFARLKFRGRDTLFVLYLGHADGCR